MSNWGAEDAELYPDVRVQAVIDPKRMMARSEAVVVRVVALMVTILALWSV